MRYLRKYTCPQIKRLRPTTYEPIRTMLLRFFFNSQFTPSQDVRLPRGAPNKRFGDLLLEKLRGISYQLRPDIIDFRDHSFYEIKTEAHAVANRAKVCYQLSHYYDLTEQIRQQHGSNVEPPWNQDLASWKPLPILPFMGQLEDMFVCTAATDYQAWPCGLVLYDVRKRKEEEREVQACRQVDSHSRFRP